MDDQTKEARQLEALFDEARRAQVEMPEALNARILADAKRAQAGFPGVFETVRAAPAPGLWSQLVAALGGWPTVGGLATVGAAGIWIGVAPPSFLPDPARLVMGDGSDIELLDVDDMAAAMSEEG